MKKTKLLIMAIMFVQSFVSIAQDLNTAQRYIKAGNSLREVRQFTKSKELLTQGLASAKKLNNKYWEATAYEYLGLLYVTLNNPSEAKRAFTSAKNIYHSLNYALSEKAVSDMMSKYNILGDDVWSYYGGIEVGSKGVKYSIIKARQGEEQIEYKIVKDGSANTQIIDFTENAINETVDSVKSFYNVLRRNNIDASDIFIAVSSGVQQEASKKAPSGTIEKDLSKAISNALPEYNKTIKVLKPCEEADWTIKGATPPSYWNVSTLTDIGSGNTKGGSYTDNSMSTCFSIPWGSSTFGKKIAGKDFEFANNFYNTNIRPEIEHSIGTKGDLTNRSIHYVSGGIYWVMCNYIHPEKVNVKICSFTKNDVDKFLEMAKSNYEGLINPDLSNIADEDIRKDAKKQIENSKKAFSKDNVIAGALIMKGWISQFENNGMKGNQFFFVRQGYVGWISGYIADKITEEYNDLAKTEGSK